MSATETSENSSALSAWQRRAAHSITLPSGQKVKIRIPGIATLLEHGDLPEDLFEIATAELTDTVAAPGADGMPVVISGAVQLVSKADDREQKLERIREFASFQRHLVAAALVEPELSYEEVTDAVREGSLPEDDLAMIAEIVQRIRFRDARGVMIGVEPLERWATFREKHGCSEDCPSCQSVLDAFSTLDLDEV